MTASLSRPAGQAGRYGRLWSLSASGCGNGLDGQARAPALGLRERAVPAVLRTLREASVPVYAARMRPARHRGRRRDRAKEPDTCRVRAGTSAYGRAGQPCSC